VKRALVGAALAAISAASLADETTLRFHGYAWDLDTGRYLYTEVHEAVVEGDRWLRGKMTYLRPDGSVLGRKVLDFSADPFVPAYRLDLLIEGYSEGVTGKPGALAMFRQEGRGAKFETASYDGQPGLLAADSGLHPLIRAHFPELMAGNKVKFRLVVSGSLDVFRFRARRIGDTTFEGRPAVQIELEPDSLLSWLTKPLELVYEPERRKLVDYRGISNVRDPVTHKQYNVHIAYYSTPPADAPKLPPGY